MPLPPSPWLIFLDDEHTGLSSLLGTLLCGLQKQQRIILVLSKRGEAVHSWAKKVGIKTYVLNQPLSLETDANNIVRRLLKYNPPESVFILADDIGSEESAQVYLKRLKKLRFDGNIIFVPQNRIKDRYYHTHPVSPHIESKRQLLREWGEDFKKAEDRESLYYYQLSIQNPADSKKNNPWIKADRTNKKPLISIIMRTRNRPDLLQQAVAAVVKQDYSNVELVVVNDGGEAVADKLDIARDKLSNVKYVSLLHNQGRAVAANTGLDFAQGDYIQFLDDDDLIDSEHLSKLYQVLQLHPAYQAAYAGIRLENQHYDFNYAFNRNILKAWNYIPIHAVLFSRELLAQGCRFDENLAAFEDWDFWIQVSQFSDFYHLAEFGGDYRQTGDSDGGTFQQTDKTEFYRLQVINKWKQQTTAEEMEDIYLSLKEYPSSNEERLIVQKVHLVAQEKDLRAQLESRALHIKEMEKHLDSQKNTIDAYKQELYKQQQAREDIAKQLQDSNAKNAVLENENQRLDNSLNAVLNSRLWRMTEPLRKFGNTLKALKRAIQKRTHQMDIVPSPQLEKRGEENNWYSSATDPNFILQSSQGRLPVGWVLINGCLETAEQEESILFFAVNNGGFIAHQMVYLDSMDGELDTLFYLPENTSAIRIDPIYGAGEFKIGRLQFIELGKLQLLRYLLFIQLKQFINKPKGIIKQFSGLLGAYKKSGGRGVLDKLMAPYLNDYPRWIKINDSLSESDRQLIREQINGFDKMTKISVIVDVKENHIHFLDYSVHSLQKQLFTNWEIILLFPQTLSNQINDWLERSELKSAFQLLTYDTKQCSERYNLALNIVQGEYLSIISAGVRLSEHALFHIAFSIDKNPNSVIIYADDDCLNKEQQRIEPHFKPDWDPLLLTAHDYIGQSFFVSLDKIKQVNGFNTELNFHQHLDLLLRLSEQYDETRLTHIPQVLFHYPQGLTDLGYDKESYRTVLSSHFKRLGMPNTDLNELHAHAWYIQYPLPKKKPLVSIIIPTRNGYEILKQCIESIVAKTSYANYEIIVVDNQSDESRSLDYLKEIENSYNVKVINYDAPFNYSAINNYAVTQSSGEVLAFLNNDIEVITPGWLEEMVALALLPKHGVVGAMLYYPNDTIQHAGVIAGIGDVAGHAWIDKKRGSKDHRDKSFVSRYMTVSTAACIVLTRDVFNAAEGFNEEQLAVAYNDVDLCLKVHSKGYHNVWTPFAELYHHESVSRGADDTTEKKQRYFNEVTYMWQEWQKLLLNDPAYNPNLSLRRGYHEPSLVSRYSKPWLTETQNNSSVVE